MEMIKSVIAYLVAHQELIVVGALYVLEQIIFPFNRKLEANSFWHLIWLFLKGLKKPEAPSA